MKKVWVEGQPEKEEGQSGGHVETWKKNTDRTRVEPRERERTTLNPKEKKVKEINKIKIIIIIQ